MESTSRTTLGEAVGDEAGASKHEWMRDNVEVSCCVRCCKE